MSHARRSEHRGSPVAASESDTPDGFSGYSRDWFRARYANSSSDDSSEYSADDSSGTSHIEEPILPAYSAADRIGHQENPAQFCETRCHQLQAQVVELRDLFAAKHEIILPLQKNSADNQTKIDRLEETCERRKTVLKELDREIKLQRGLNWVYFWIMEGFLTRSCQRSACMPGWTLLKSIVLRVDR